MKIQGVASLVLVLLAIHLAEAVSKPAGEVLDKAVAEGNPGRPEDEGDREEADLKEEANSRHRSRMANSVPQKKTTWKGETDRTRDNNNNEENESYRKFSGIRYTPQDLAEYIIKTRDEEGVALAIEELLQEGLIHRDEAIQYLESVKSELSNMKHQYALSQEAKQWKTNTMPYPMKQEKSKQFHARMKQIQRTGEKRKQFSAPSKTQNVDSQQPPQQQQQTARNPSIHLKNEPKLEEHVVKSTTQAPVKNSSHVEDDHKPVATDKRANSEPVPDSKVKEVASSALYEEYLLEKVIYQLAKDMFTQSLMRDDASAEQLLSKFASFLESELSQKKFSKATQEKILDTVSTALIESLRERLYNGN